MSEMREAWNKTTGEKLPYLVPTHFIGHPVLGKNIVGKPPKKTEKAEPAPTKERAK